jgi:hypothetical protein
MYRFQLGKTLSYLNHQAKHIIIYGWHQGLMFASLTVTDHYHSKTLPLKDTHRQICASTYKPQKTEHKVIL